jgi:uncharacterized heparinase superfamily protein
MARVDLAYARSLLRVAAPADLLRVVARRVGERLSRPSPPAPLDDDAIAAAAAALARAPRIFAVDGIADDYRALFPDAVTRLRARGQAILRHEIDVFGVARSVGERIDWRRDPLSGRRCDGAGLFPDGVDPKGAWELARAGHLVELAAAARVCAELMPRARAEIAVQIGSFLDDNSVGAGIHYASPLEVALRCLHWLAALELAGGAAAFSPAFVARLAAALLADGRFLAAHLEDRGIVPANHLLGNWVGLYALGLALDGAPRARRWRDDAERALAAECARQVGRDGAHFEASTAYHRFALELVLAAHLWARAADRPSPVIEALHRMFVFVRGYLGPDGCEPAFGDGDDARLFPIVPRAAREHAYLLPVGATLFGDPELRAPGQPLCEEALWLAGAAAARRVWDWLPARPAPSSASFPTGGVHVLRSEHWQVALRSGSYGQKGVGGHAHNDQLALVAWLDGAPLVVDSGTARYAADMVLRDRFRGTAAHSTIVVDGQEQSPILRGRPFALMQAARVPPVVLEDTGARASVVGEHAGYTRLPCRARHRRKLTLRRDLDAVVVEDVLSGRGAAAVEQRWHLAQPVSRRLSDAARCRLDELAAALGPLAADGAVMIGETCVLVRSAPDTTEPSIETTLFSPSYGWVESRPLVSYRALLTFPKILTTILFRVGA